MSDLERTPVRTRLFSAGADGDNSTSTVLEIRNLLHHVLELKKMCIKTNKLVNDLQAQVRKLSADNTSAHTSNTLAINAVNETIISNESIVKESVREVVSAAFPNTLSKTITIHSYANVVKQKPALLITPVNAAQSCIETRNTMREKINPVGLPISDVRNGSHGSIVIECNDKDSSDQLKAEVAEKLGSSYTVNIMAKRLPKIRIIGLSEELSAEELAQKILNQNTEIQDGGTLKILHIFKLPRSSNFGAKIEIDPVSFKKILELQKLRIGWDICQVYEAFDLLQCYSCSEYHHSAKNCTNPLSCSRCSGGHKRSDCSSTFESCTNCKLASSKLKINLDLAHSATSKSCPVYIRKITQEKRRINYNDN